VMRTQGCCRRSRSADPASSCTSAKAICKVPWSDCRERNGGAAIQRGTRTAMGSG
jgi:hypothetical protein